MTPYNQVPAARSRRCRRWAAAGKGLLLLALVQGAATAAEPVAVQCSAPADPPLARKFGFANAGSVPVSRYERDVPALALLQPDSLRLELALGKPGAGWTLPIAGGTPGNVRYNWTELDRLARLLGTNGVSLTIAHCYTPEVMQRDAWNAPPASMPQWATLLREMVFHARTDGERLGAHEIWNSPDLPACFDSTRGTYFQLFKQAALALRDGDPDAPVGAPVIADKADWVQPFLDFVEFERLPLDFFAFQAVSPATTDKSWGPALTRLANVRRALAGNPRRARTAISLSAFNPLPRAEFRPGGAVDQPALAATVLDNLEQFLRETDVTAVEWASLMDAGGKEPMLGVLDEKGNPRPAFGAFAFYAGLPVDRVQAQAPAPLRILAGADDRRAGAIVWNPSATTQSAEVRLDALPFDGGRLRVHQLDAQHPLALNRSNTWTLVPQATRDFSGKTVSWKGDLPAGGVVYLAAEPTVASTPPVFRDPALRGRIYRYFPERGKSGYADFDRRDWTVRLGMGAEDRGAQMLGLSLAFCPTNLTITVQPSGNPRKLDQDSLLALRVDFYDRSTLTSSTLYHAGLYDPASAPRPPWSNGRPPDKVVPCEPGQPWTVDLSASSAQYMGRRAIFTFLLQNAGSGARVKFAIAGRK